MADTVAGIIHYRDPQAVAELVASMRGWSAPPDAVLVADNSAADVPVGAVAAEVLPMTHNRGYAGAANRLLAAARARGAKRLLLLTQDARLERDAHATLIAALDADPVAAVAAPMLRFASDTTTVFSAGGHLRRNGRAGHHDRGTAADGRHRGVRDVHWGDGACLLIDLDAAAAVGDFDEEYFLYVEEIDLQHRLRQAGRAIVMAYEALAHQEPGGYGHYLYFKHRNTPRFAAKFADELAPWPWHLELLLDLARLIRHGTPAEWRWAVRGSLDARTGWNGPRPRTATGPRPAPLPSGPPLLVDDLR